MPKYVVSHTRTWEVEAEGRGEAYELLLDMVHANFPADSAATNVELVRADSHSVYDNERGE